MAATRAAAMMAAEAPSSILAAAAPRETIAPRIPTLARVSVARTFGAPRDLIRSTAPAWSRGHIVSLALNCRIKAGSDGSCYSSGIRQRGASGRCFVALRPRGNRRRLRRNSLCACSHVRRMCPQYRLAFVVELYERVAVLEDITSCACNRGKAKAFPRFVLGCIVDRRYLGGVAVSSIEPKQHYAEGNDRSLGFFVLPTVPSSNIPKAEQGK